MSKQQVSSQAFRQARLEGKTYKELSSQFGISVAACKEICSRLELPKRAKSKNYELVEESNNQERISA